jgi:hypothetical protein
MSQTPYREPSWLTGGAVVFAGVMMALIGILQILQGIAALFEDQFFVVSENYVFDVDVTAWGWIHLLLGLLVLFAAYSLMAGNTYGRVLGLVLAGLSAVVNFLWIPYYPFWSILMVALAVWVIWALTSRWDEATGRRPRE